jgi:hypothetical protein
MFPPLSGYYRQVLESVVPDAAPLAQSNSLIPMWDSYAHMRESTESTSALALSLHRQLEPCSRHSESTVYCIIVVNRRQLSYRSVCIIVSFWIYRIFKHR